MLRVNSENSENNFTKNNNNLFELIKQIDISNGEYKLLSNNECSICLNEFIIKPKSKSKFKLNNIIDYSCIKYILNIFGFLYIESNEPCILSCKHIYHHKCILEWFQKEITCPLCRKIPYKH